MDSVKQGSGTRDQILNGVRKKLNLTEGEWATLQELTGVTKKDVDYYGNDTLEITFRRKVLSFRGTGKASRLDSVSFDLGRNIALFRQRPIPFMGIFHIAASDNGFHTPVVTYEMNNNYMTDSTDVNTVHMERYDFGISYQPMTRKTSIIFMTATANMRGGAPVIQPEILTFAIE